MKGNSEVVFQGRCRQNRLPQATRQNQRAAVADASYKTQDASVVFALA